MAEVHWRGYLSALLTPAVAGFAVYVAKSQWTTTRNRLRFDLFEKRFAVYQGARHFVGSVLANGTARHEELVKYLHATHAAKWIVSQDIHDYFESELYNPALELERIDSEIDNLRTGEERTRTVEQRKNLRIHFHKQLDQLDTRFSPYLQLKH